FHHIRVEGEFIFQESLSNLRVTTEPFKTCSVRMLVVFFVERAGIEPSQCPERRTAQHNSVVWCGVDSENVLSHKRTPRVPNKNQWQIRVLFFDDFGERPNFSERGIPSTGA